jgi:hypothetical protein
MRRPRKAQPGLEGLEGRQLLSVSTSATDSSTSAITPAATSTGSGSSSSSGSDSSNTPTGQQLSKMLGISQSDRRISYRTPQGAHVTLTVFGVGSLAGTTVDPNGDLHLVFSQTNDETGIIGKVRGGPGVAPLATIQHADVGLDNFSGVGTTLLNIVNLKNFNLIDGGQINLAGGLHQLYLNSVGTNTQIHLRESPTLAAPSPSTTTSATENGVNLQFVTNVAGARTLTSTAGEPVIVNFASLAGVSQSAATIGVNPGPPPAPPGVVVSINHINGRPRASTSLQDPEVYGYDPTANALIRFDTVTGAELQTIPLAGVVTGTVSTGVTLGRNAEQLVALVGNGSTVYAFNALSGAYVGQFTTANLSNFTTVNGLASTDNRTVLINSTAGTGGLAQVINLTASLAAGKAVTVNSAFAPQNEFTFAPGATGVAGQNTIYVTGSAFFNTQTPNLTQAGIMAIGVSTTGKLSESSRTALKSGGSFLVDGTAGSTPTFPFGGLGSIDQSLALLTGVSGGKNVVVLYNPSTLAAQNSLTLNDPNQLSDISESFRPSLVDTALLDVQGNVQSIRAMTAKGLVMNVEGYLNLTKIHNTTDSTFVALPFAHAQMPARSNVTILSSPRSVGERNGVTIVPNIQPAGPLSLPTPGPPT